jgi:hypothetical protein
MPAASAGLDAMVRTRPVMFRWVLETACGFLLGCLTARATFNFGLGGLSPFSPLPRWGLTGIATAGLQTWLVNDLLPPRGRWLVATTVGFLLAGLPAEIPSPDPNSFMLTWAIGGALIGTILIPETLDWRLRQLILWTAAGIIVALATGPAIQRASRA